ncbi:MAG: YigZ family protein [Bacteroidaceae bacterium]|nr:YigZ family protein [Bacteroidaceae bacterium]MBR1787736.1 YigZ family protein [Bacteroidaceae bacterium]
MQDSYLTIKASAKGEYSEKRSKFLAFAFHVETTDEIKDLVSQIEREYYDARHVCYAYMLGHQREQYRTVDNGEPSGTAGKPILGQINKNELTDILIIVVRYFGGIKLGTSGLTNAYKQAAIEAIANSEIEERTVDCIIKVHFEYTLMNDVMRVVKELNPKVLSQDFQIDCSLRLQIRMGDSESLTNRLKLIRGVSTELD